MITWLETNKIKLNNQSIIGPLNNIKSPDWNKTFVTYKGALNCPNSVNEKEAELDWCLGHALQKEYEAQSKY